MKFISSKFFINDENVFINSLCHTHSTKDLICLTIVDINIYVNILIILYTITVYSIYICSKIKMSRSSRIYFLQFDILHYYLEVCIVCNRLTYIFYLWVHCSLIKTDQDSAR